MTEPLYNAIAEVGERQVDLTEGLASQVELDSLMEMTHSYSITADPANDRYLLQDDQHQYELKIHSVDPDNNFAYASARETRFSKDGLENVAVLKDDDFAAPSPGDEAIFNDPSNALDSISERAADSSVDHLL